MWNGTIFVDLDWPLNASSLLSASAELLVFVTLLDVVLTCSFVCCCVVVLPLYHAITMLLASFDITLCCACRCSCWRLAFPKPLTQRRTKVWSILPAVSSGDFAPGVSADFFLCKCTRCTCGRNKFARIAGDGWQYWSHFGQTLI